MTRISLISVEYCSLETPAMSAAPYAHQWQTKPNILGLNLSPVPIRSQLLCHDPRLRPFPIGPLARLPVSPFVGCGRNKSAAIEKDSGSTG
jgi:hypothetical protein